MGALAISVVLSLVATPAVYYVLLKLFGDSDTQGAVGAAQDLELSS
jgi:hypothetical protein